MIQNEQITSIKDPKVVEARELATAAGREKLIEQAFNAQLKQTTDLNGSQVILLMILKCDQIMSLEQVSKDTATFAEERAALLQPLFAKQYIRYYDTNEQSIMLTDAGEQALAQLWSLIERAEQEALAGFSEQEKAQLDGFLKRIQDNCLRITQ